MSRTRSNYDPLEETQWPCTSFGQLSENRGKRLSHIRLRGISSANREKRQSSTRRSVFSGVCRARGVTTTLSRKRNGRARHLANFRKIEENDCHIRLRGISSANREKRQSSTRRSVFSGVCRARGVTTTLPRKPNGRARHFANFRKIEENDIVRSVYGGSVGETRIYIKTCFNKVPCRADRCVNGGSNKEPLI